MYFNYNIHQIPSDLSPLMDIGNISLHLRDYFATKQTKAVWIVGKLL